MNDSGQVVCKTSGDFVFASNFKNKVQGGLRRRKCSGDNFRKPLITVITVVFNGERTLQRAISSIVDDLNDDVEYIIIDGGSTDGTLEIIRRNEEKIDLWLSEPDRGIYDAWNKGVALASGRWISFIGADDCYRGGALSEYIDFIVHHGDESLEYVSSRINLVSDGGRVRAVGKRWNWKDFKRYMNVGHVGSMHNRSLFLKYGLYDVDYKICGDYEFLLRPGADLRADFMDVVTVDMSVGGVSNSSLLVFEEARRAKVITGKRGMLISHVEKYIAVLKWRIRNCIWY